MGASNHVVVFWKPLAVGQGCGHRGDLEVNLLCANGLRSQILQPRRRLP